MIRATQVRASHRWSETPADTVVLDFDDRHRRRMAITATRGLEFLLDLENAVALRGGDALVLDDGRLIEVVAAPEPLLEIRGHDPHHLVRVAWHLGNRHLPTQITAKGLRIRRDESGHLPADASLFEIVADFERRKIIEQLEASDWSQTAAAEALRIPLSTLNQKIKRLNIDVRKRSGA